MEISQILANSLIRGAELSLLAIGLTMVFDILKFANFAHPDYAVLGAFFAYVFNKIFGVNLVLSVLFAAFVTGWVGILIDQAIFKRLRMMGAKPVTLMIASMGTAIAMRNLMRLIWSSHTKSYTLPIRKPLVILDARITPLQIVIILSGLISMIAFHQLLHRTTFGKALRAISDNSFTGVSRPVIYVMWLTTIARVLGVMALSYRSTTCSTLSGTIGTSISLMLIPICLCRARYAPYPPGCS